MPQTLYASCCQGLPEFHAEFGIAIVQQVATAVQMSRLLECRVASCLAHPTRIRMICDSSDGDPSAVQVDEKQNIVSHQHSPGQHFDPEEVGAGEDVHMAA